MLAEKFYEWLPAVIQQVEPFLSSEDIDKGKRGMNIISSELESAQFGIFFLTRQNLQAPWIYFEAGAISKVVTQANVIPFLFDVSDKELSPGNPLLQFQYAKPTRDDIFRVLLSINKACSPMVPEGSISFLFERVWQDLETGFEQVRAESRKLGITPALNPIDQEKWRDATLSGVLGKVNKVESKVTKVESNFEDIHKQLKDILVRLGAEVEPEKPGSSQELDYDEEYYYNVLDSEEGLRVPRDLTILAQLLDAELREGKAKVSREFLDRFVLFAKDIAELTGDNKINWYLPRNF